LLVSLHLSGTQAVPVSRHDLGPSDQVIVMMMGADVVVSDPHVDDGFVPSGVERVDCTAAELAAADVAVLLVDHDSFDYDLISAAPYVFDCRHRLRAGRNIEFL